MVESQPPRNASSEFLSRSRYYLVVEYPTKLRHCIAVLPEEVVWQRLNPTSNSIGNLLVHLTGNVRQWVLGGIAGREVSRNRPAEFSSSGGVSGAELLLELERALAEVDAVLAGLSEADLQQSREIQGRTTTVLAAIYHVVEHFAMHAGQIVLLTKLHIPGSVSFYDDSTAAARPRWGGAEGTE